MLPVQTAQCSTQAAVLLLPVCGASAQPACDSSPPLYDKWRGAERANREVAPVGSLGGRVTTGSGPGIHCSMILVRGDGYLSLIYAHTYIHCSYNKMIK